MANVLIFDNEASIRGNPLHNEAIEAASGEEDLQLAKVNHDIVIKGDSANRRFIETICGFGYRRRGDASCQA